MRFFAFGLFLVAAAAAVRAEEVVLFQSGARMRVDRHEFDGSKCRLFHNGGFTEMDAVQISTIEAAEPARGASGAPSADSTGPSAVPAPATPANSPADLADRAADRYGLPRALVRSVILAESAFDPAAVSPKGAIGLMQLMPETARELGADPRDPAQNVDAGTRYLRDLLLRYDYRLWHALAAYNAGPGAVDSHGGVPPYRETIQYIRKVEKVRGHTTP
jgi:soluble lytic murein transglycosylase-like protein